MSKLYVQEGWDRFLDAHRKVNGRTPPDKDRLKAAYLSGVHYVAELLDSAIERAVTAGESLSGAVAQLAATLEDELEYFSSQWADVIEHGERASVKDSESK